MAKSKSLASRMITRQNVWPLNIQGHNVQVETNVIRLWHRSRQNFWNFGP